MFFKIYTFPNNSPTTGKPLIPSPATSRRWFCLFYSEPSVSTPIVVFNTTAQTYVAKEIPHDGKLIDEVVVLRLSHFALAILLLSVG